MKKKSFYIVGVLILLLIVVAIVALFLLWNYEYIFPPNRGSELKGTTKQIIDPSYLSYEEQLQQNNLTGDEVKSDYVADATTAEALLANSADEALREQVEASVIKLALLDTEMSEELRRQDHGTGYLNINTLDSGEKIIRIVFDRGYERMSGCTASVLYLLSAQVDVTTGEFTDIKNSRTEIPVACDL